MADSKILIVEDDRTLLEALKYRMSKEGYTVCTALDGVQALEVARAEKPDLIILDIMLPNLDGLEVCRILRKKGMNVPILMLTAKAEEIDRVVGLELGADDYITKPFSIRELLARSRHQVSLGGSIVNLSPKGFEILAFLARNRGMVISRDILLEKIWGYDFEGDTRTVDVHIRWLREKLEPDPANPRRILTVRGVGYKFEG